MAAHPAIRPGGRSERVRTAVLDAVDAMRTEPGAITVAALAERAGVSQVTIYRRWGRLERVILDAAVRSMLRASPIEPSGDLAADLTRWATRVQRGASTPANRRLLAAVTAAEPDDVQEYLGARLAEIERLIAAAEPPSAITPEEIIDRVLAPVYMRALFGYRTLDDIPELVARALAASGPDAAG